ncbi:MAG: preprotein translocase subunit SecE [bacterium]|nr:preprotein translocase subunit SecE [bacterium]
MAMFKSITAFLAEARGELTKVAWPTKSQTARLTTLVITVSLLVGLYLGTADWLLKQALERLVLR